MKLQTLLLLALASTAGAQTYDIETVAGGGPAVGDVVANLSLFGWHLRGPQGVATDFSGNVYIATGQVWAVNPSGVITQVIGNAVMGYGGDGGPAASAEFFEPSGLAVDSSGNIYVADTVNNRIRKVSGGIITTLAGNGTAGYSGDGGPATSAELGQPYGVAVDSSGNIYIADTGNCVIREVSGGIIRTVAGNGACNYYGGYSGDGGPATGAELSVPYGVAVDSSGNLYIADSHNNRIRKVSAGIITTVAGGGTDGLGDGGPATSAGIGWANGVTVDSSGNIYIADGDRIRKVDDNGIITTVAGGGLPPDFLGDGGPATSAFLDNVQGVAVDSAGNLYIAETSGVINDNRVRKVSAGIITTFAGNGTFGYGGDGGPATSAELDDEPNGVALDSSGNFYIADPGSLRIRKVSAGIITTVAGGGVNHDSLGDGGPATSAELDGPQGLAVDSGGNIYIADTNDNVIRKVSGGIITTVAGNGTAGYSGDGDAATGAELNYPWGVALDSDGNIYIADSGNDVIRKVSGGIITTVAGNGKAGYSGDGGPATGAQLGFPTAVAVDSSGDIYIADTWNHRVRKVSGGIITTVAGDGTPSYGGDGGAATSAQLNQPIGVTVDAGGNLYIGDSWNNRVRKVSGGIITTIAGNGYNGYNGDGGPAASAELYSPRGVAVDSDGNVYIADLGNSRIRQLVPPRRRDRRP
jgi:sugar lactone lactonase YvrE